MIENLTWPLVVYLLCRVWIFRDVAAEMFMYLLWGGCCLRASDPERLVIRFLDVLPTCRCFFGTQVSLVPSLLSGKGYSYSFESQSVNSYSCFDLMFKHFKTIYKAS